MGNVIFKGIDSGDILGLIISEQPTITRAPRKIETIDVDGMDGDVVNYLGYDSYAKEISIGLHDEYDIDQVANFFSDEGWVVFSNEPTKKYWGRITNGVDFESLLRYKTAKVRWIVQPYKKLVTESLVSSTVSGFSVVNQGFVDSKPVVTVFADGGEIIDVDINGITIMTITMPSEGYIIIDSEASNCYNSNADKNQYVVMGDNFPLLRSGENIIEWSGSVTKMTVQPNSRWL